MFVQTSYVQNIVYSNFFHSEPTDAEWKILLDFLDSYYQHESQRFALVFDFTRLKSYFSFARITEMISFFKERYQTSKEKVIATAIITPNETWKMIVDQITRWYEFSRPFQFFSNFVSAREWISTIN